MTDEQWNEIVRLSMPIVEKLKEYGHPHMELKINQNYLQLDESKRGLPIKGNEK